MPLPYKLLKSITIDGVTSGLDPDLGHLVAEDSKTVNISSTWTNFNGAKVTLTDPGTYFIQTRATFQAGSGSSLTGNNFTIFLKINGETSRRNMAQEIEWFPEFLAEPVALDTIVVLGDADVPAEVEVAFVSGAIRNNCDSRVRAYKLIHI